VLVVVAISFVTLVVDGVDSGGTTMLTGVVSGVVDVGNPGGGMVKMVVPMPPDPPEETCARFRRRRVYIGVYSGVCRGCRCICQTTFTGK